MQDDHTVLRVGLAGVGLRAYWGQFEGLQEKLRGYVDLVEQRISVPSRRVVNLGLVDDDSSARLAARRCTTEEIDLLLIYVTTYALSSTILPLIKRAGVPVILLNLQPEAAIDYERFNALKDRQLMTGEWLAFCSACPVPEIANVLKRLSIPFFQVTGALEDDHRCWRELEEWLRAAEVMHGLAESRLGLMGHYYSGMLDVATDLVQVSGRFGIGLEMIEVDQLSALRRTADAEAVERRIQRIMDEFDVSPECMQAELEQAARTSVALDGLVAESGLNMLAYYYKGLGVKENEDTMTSIIVGASLLTGTGLPVAGEYEVKNVIAMKILDLLGAGGSFTEYYAMDFKRDVVLMGHDGPGHVRIAQQKIKVKPLQVYHGKVGQGLSVEMSVRHGEVTLLSVVEDRERGFKLLIAEGESVQGPILEIGNTNGSYRFGLGAAAFVEQWSAHGPAHHCAVGTGHCADTLKKVASLLNLESIQVC